MHLADADVHGEREERGWWAGRLKAVRREIAAGPLPAPGSRRERDDEEMLRRAVEGVVMAKKPSREPRRPS
jgi:hypothetical protein